jgi:SAM-dependent methyltransferase
LPVLLPYSTRTHDEFEVRHGSAARRLGAAYHRPDARPARGEEFVLNSFSEEWLDYSYDGVVWTWTYADREALLLAEMGGRSGDSRLSGSPPRQFIEIGCGLGLVTSFAEKSFGVDAVGVDLSLAALRAERHFAGNPFLHFVQASLWSLPFAARSFDFVYSHGVLHHTYSTEEALRAVSRLCAPGGTMYVWVYGLDSIHESMARRAAYGVEHALRPILARLPSRLASAALAPIAVAYMGINRMQRRLGSRREPYSFQRALHAARDRLTPLFAHRTRQEDLARWFRNAGFQNLHVLDPAETPEATRETIRRNVGMRGVQVGGARDREPGSEASGTRDLSAIGREKE